ncbi:MAG: hypothetical protein ABJC04_07950, partial [Verrucomicrobiota bacterium]
KNIRAYVLNFAENGEFIVEDVAAGKYTLSIALQGKFDPNVSAAKKSQALKDWAEKPIAMIRQDLTIPELNDTDHQPLDLGVLEMKTANNVKSIY